MLSESPVAIKKKAGRRVRDLPPADAEKRKQNDRFYLVAGKIRRLSIK